MELTPELREAIKNPPECWWETGNNEDWGDMDPTAEYVLANFDVLVKDLPCYSGDETEEDVAGDLYRCAAAHMLSEQMAEDADGGIIRVTVYARHSACAGRAAPIGSSGYDFVQFAGTEEELRAEAERLSETDSFGFEAAKAIRDVLDWPR